jgi:modulator of FtsH protease HflK
MAERPKDQEPQPQEPAAIEGEPQEIETPNEGLVSGRSASIRFSRERKVGGAANQERMDAANQSLADALRITYGFLQVGMVVLLILFVFSGFQKINEGERGISIFLGKPSRTQLEPGAHLTWPYPIGELIRVGGGAVEVPLARDFMPNSPNARSGDEAILEMPIDQFSGQGRLNPVRDNSLITADLNIAHTQWTVNYHRSNHLRFVEHILPEQERMVIVIAARRGVVQTMAETTIDDLLKKSAESIAAKVRVIAQQTLDDLESGITIDRVVLVRKTPPLFLLDRFASVQSAAQNAGKAREDALLKRDQSLNTVAGRAAPVLISMIEAYERDIELGEIDKASAMLEQIDTVLAGGEVNYQGQETLALVSGEISEILNEARAKSSSRVSQAIADLELFKAKQAQFEANPSLMIARDWSLAMNEFLNKDFVSTMYLPEGVDAELLVNHDPDIERERDRIRKRKEALAGMIQRREDLNKDQFKSQRGIKPEDEP